MSMHILLLNFSGTHATCFIGSIWLLWTWILCYHLMYIYVYVGVVCVSSTIEWCQMPLRGVQSGCCQPAPLVRPAAPRAPRGNGTASIAICGYPVWLTLYICCIIHLVDAYISYIYIHAHVTTLLLISIILLTCVLHMWVSYHSINSTFLKITKFSNNQNFCEIAQNQKMSNLETI